MVGGRTDGKATDHVTEGVQGGSELQVAKLCPQLLPGIGLQLSQSPYRLSRLSHPGRGQTGTRVGSGCRRFRDATARPPWPTVMPFSR